MDREGLERVLREQLAAQPLIRPVEERTPVQLETLSLDFIAFEEEEKKEERKPFVPHVAAGFVPLLRFNVPWMSSATRRYSEDPCERLHEEIVDFTAYMSPSEEERYARSEAIRRLETVVLQLWPSTPETPVKLVPFGSFDSQLFLPSSDIDVVVLHGGLPSEAQQRQEHTKPPLKKLARAIAKAGLAEPGTLKALIHARVPIVKYVDALSNYELDVSINVSSGLDAAHFMQQAMRAQPAIRPLVLLLKHFLQMRGLNMLFTGGLGSYAIMCLVISFLQLHPLVQGGLIRAHENLGVLLLDFFDLFGRHFSYDQVGISVRRDGGAYFRKEDRGWLNEAKPHLLSLEDPLDEDNDITKGSFAIMSVRQAFEHAFAVLRATFEEYHEWKTRFLGVSRNDKVPSLLASIVSLPDQLLRHRYYIQQTTNL